MSQPDLSLFEARTIVTGLTEYFTFERTVSTAIGGLFLPQNWPNLVAKSQEFDGLVYPRISDQLLMLLSQKLQIPLESALDFYLSTLVPMSLNNWTLLPAGNDQRIESMSWVYRGEDTQATGLVPYLVQKLIEREDSYATAVLLRPNY